VVIMSLSCLCFRSLSFGMVLQGIGKSPRMPFVSYYIDENVEKRKTSIYLGKFWSLYPLITVYVEISKSEKFVLSLALRNMQMNTLYHLFQIEQLKHLIHEGYACVLLGNLQIM
jgi:hypothetical protein